MKVSSLYVLERFSDCLLSCRTTSTYLQFCSQFFDKKKTYFPATYQIINSCTSLTPRQINSIRPKCFPKNERAEETCSVSVRKHFRKVSLSVTQPLIKLREECASLWKAFNDKFILQSFIRITFFSANTLKTLKYN